MASPSAASPEDRHFAGLAFDRAIRDGFFASLGCTDTGLEDAAAAMRLERFEANRDRTGPSGSAEPGEQFHDLAR